MNIISDSFSYAFRESGKYMLIIGAILSVISSIASFVPIVGLLAYVFLSGFFCATYFSLIQSSAVGHSEAPNFPDVSDIVQDLIWPMVKVFLIGFLSFAPYIFYNFYVLTNGGEEDLISNLLFILGAIYFPMAILAVVVLGYLGAFTPTIVIPSIFRAGWLYWLAVVLLFIIYTLKGILTFVLGSNLILGTLIMGVVGMYVLMTSARILGLVYKNKEEELGWL